VAKAERHGLSLPSAGGEVLQRTFVNGCARFAWRGKAIASPPAPFVTAFHGFVTRATAFVTSETIFVTAETLFVTAETTRRLGPAALRPH
jgi:hypothetical protein